MKKHLIKIYESNDKRTNKFIYWYVVIGLKLIKKYRVILRQARKAIKSYEGLENGTKEYQKRLEEIFIYRYLYDIKPEEFYLLKMSEKEKFEARTFMPKALTARYYKMINDSRYQRIIDNKNLTYKVLKEFYKRDLIMVSKNDKDEEFINFCQNKKSFMLKPIASHGGDGIKIIKIEENTNLKKLFKNLMVHAPYVAEELISQSKEMSKLHKESVNTVRVVVFQYLDQASLLFSFLRVGQGDNIVDNMGSLGMGAEVDVTSGKVISDGVDWKGTHSEVHPDTGIKFNGLQIPDWDKLLETIPLICSKTPDIHCIGMDFAHTDKGWVLVEENFRPQCLTIQVIRQKGVKNLYYKMYTLIKNLKEGENSDKK